MTTVLVMDDKLECWLADNIPPEILSVPLPDEVADKVVEHLKQEADRYWAINTERSLELARRIIAIGNARNDEAQAALGWMARGDALRFSGQMEEAWDTLELAGKMFNTARDKVGWARTRIGRLYLAVKLNHVKETLVDGKEAQKIFRSNRKYELMVRLNMGRAVVYGSLGNAHRALRLLRSAITLAETLGTTGEKHLGVLYMNLGLAHEVLGDFSRALTYYERARSICIARNETRNIALIEINIAYIAQAQGHYRRSLELLHDMLEQGLDQFPMECLAVKRDMTECYIYLNRYNDACDLALQVVDGYRRFGSAYEIARSLLHQATAEAESGNFLVAHARLEEAGRIFANLGATSWEATTRLRRGRIALKQDNHTAAFQEADAAAADFKSSGQRVNYAAALMLKGQALFASENFDEAAKAGVNALQIAQHYNVPSLRYTSHLLLGKIAEVRSEIQRAVRRYQAAASTIERVQRGLTITLRPGFLEDKGEASRALIGLYLQAGQTDKAFETVERVKSQVLLGYLLNREHLRWTQDTSQSRLLVDELNRLRAEHQWFHRLAYDPPRRAERPSSISREQALAEISVRERRMRAITEQLYLHSGNGQQTNRVPTTSLNDIQHVLDHDTLLIEFYNDGGNVWAFILEHGAIEVHRLPLTVGTLNQMLAQLQTNLSAALSVAPQTPAGLGINQLAQRILRRLYALLVEPLALDRRNPSAW
jgi:tetratricopeptide (TPR) repeat protein